MEIAVREPFAIDGIGFEAFPVDHSTNAPTVGYQITARGVTIFCVPVVAYIPDWSATLAGSQFYVETGATLTRPIVRRQADIVFGHAPVRTQLTCCQYEDVPRAIFTHCGSEIIR